MLTAETKGAFETLKRVCLKAPVLASLDFNKPFLLETNGSKVGLATLLSQNRLTDNSIWWHMPADP